jgi:hypothetical protein
MSIVAPQGFNCEDLPENNGRSSGSAVQIEKRFPGKKMGSAFLGGGNPVSTA